MKNIGETTRSICLNSISISTSAGSVPSISASGEEVELNATASCKYEIDEFTVSKKHHAQVLWDAFKLMEDEIEGVEGVHLNSASYSLTCGIGKATKDGVCLSHDVVQGKIECSVEFVQTLKDRSPENALTPGEGWTITSPMKCSNKDADFPTWTATLTKYLVKAN